MCKDLKRQRGFEIVGESFRKHKESNIELPIRADIKSAGYDIKTPVEIILKPQERKLIFTDIKAYMQDDEVLELYVRSSVGIKKGVVLSNGTGIIDSSYYSNKDNDGNLGLALYNTLDKEVVFESGERICQGVFKKYLTVDDDNCINSERNGGFGSSGVK
ncbi:MAG: dUTP diphosphatase [Veillonella parvula]|uniref:dUTP diphosphatase n=1 Tax=Veillonella parvula TaxID=29466 RepID=A0A943ABR0_VEIPA|nr:dUTP diphosphatase [Veillonella parvula]MBS4894023.1 dUTP diphosphatase [Veillonella parvula]